MARNLITSGKAELVGMDDLRDKIRAIRDDIAGEAAQAVFAKIAKAGADLARAKAKSANWPHDAVESIFEHGKPGQDRYKVTALFGVRKRGRERPWAVGYREWGKRTGHIVGESLATMFEYGTSKMDKRPAIRPTVTELRRTVPQDAADGLKQVVAKYTR